MSRPDASGAPVEKRRLTLARRVHSPAIEPALRVSPCGPIPSGISLSPLCASECSPFSGPGLLRHLPEALCPLSPQSRHPRSPRGPQGHVEHADPGVNRPGFEPPSAPSPATPGEGPSSTWDALSPASFPMHGAHSTNTRGAAAHPETVREVKARATPLPTQTRGN